MVSAASSVRVQSWRGGASLVIATSGSEKLSFPRVRETAFNWQLVCLVMMWAVGVMPQGQWVVCEI